MKHSSKKTGGCLCGAIRYVIRGEVHIGYNCHCVDCRRASGAPFVAWAFCELKDYEVVKGTPAKIEYADRERSFCPHCGTPLTFQNPKYLDDIDVTVCSMDRPDLFPPKGHIWLEDKISWVNLNDGLPQHLGYPKS